MTTTNWSSQQQLNNNSNTLSYGSLKNRFLSGASKNNTGSATATSSGANISNNTANKPSSKLFSLAR